MHNYKKSVYWVYRTHTAAAAVVFCPYGRFPSSLTPSWSVLCQFIITDQNTHMCVLQIQIGWIRETMTQSSSRHCARLTYLKSVTVPVLNKNNADLDSASDSFSTMALYKSIYLLTYLLTYLVLTSCDVMACAVFVVELIRLFDD